MICKVMFFFIIDFSLYALLEKNDITLGSLKRERDCIFTAHHKESLKQSK